MMAAILLSLAPYVSAQQPACQLRQAPELNGFRIGMVITDVKSRLADPSTFEAGTTASANKIGVQAIQILGAELKDEYSEGIDVINLTFVDMKLAIIKATYNGVVTWMGSQDFFKQVSQKLALPQPSPGNTSRGRGNEKYKLECTGFTAILAYSFGVSPSVTVYDTVAQKLVEGRAIQNPDGEVKDIRITPGRPPVTRRPR